MKNQENQEQESYWDRLKAFREQEGSLDRLKAFKDKKIPFTDKGKATVASVPGALVIFESLRDLPGHAGVAVSLAAVGLTALHGEKAFKLGRWLKGKFIEENDPPSQSEESATDERVAGDSETLPRSEEKPIKESFLGRGSFEKLLNEDRSEHPENETLRLGVDIKKKRRFDPWINDLFGKGMIVAAVQGSGKSMLCGLIIEQAAKCGAPAFVFDHKGEYPEIVDLPFVNGLRAGSDRLRSRVNCFELSADNAYDFVQLVMQERYQAIIHLPSYGDGWLDRAEAVAAVGSALMRYSAYQRECGNPIIPALVFQDEAQLYIPQDPRMLPPEARKNSDILDSLNNAYFALVSNGRSNGYTMCFATPSLTYVAKSMIKSCQVRVLMRHAEKNDLDMCEQIVNGAATREEIESMPVGTGIVFGFTPKPVVVKFDTRQSRDLSETPGIERLRQSKGAEDLPVKQVVQYQPVKSTIRHISEDDRKVKRAHQYWQDGHASVRKLEAVSGWSNGETRRIIRLMKEQGLVE
jgi:hypothetical protein